MTAVISYSVDDDGMIPGIMYPIPVDCVTGTFSRHELVQVQGQPEKTYKFCRMEGNAMLVEGGSTTMPNDNDVLIGQISQAYAYVDMLGTRRLAEATAKVSYSSLKDIG